jgi:hypothetical protein
MPSNPLDDILREVDPIDAATLFAGLRNSVPLGMLFRSGALNEGEQQELERRYASVPRAPLPPVREPTIEEQIAQFERDFPNPVMRKVMVDEIMRMRAAQPQQPVAQPRGPRREYAQPIPAQFISPIRKAGGGGIFKKTLDEMQAELAKKGAKATKAADPDLSRRAFFGLSPKTDFPLVNIPTSELEKLRNAPSITEKTTTVKPSPTAPKIEETVKKVAETPVSRRTLLKSASGQVLKGVLPETGLPGVEDIAKSVAESAVQDVASPAAPGLYSLVMSAIKQGMSRDEAIDFVKRNMPQASQPENLNLRTWAIYNNLSDPMLAPSDYEFFGPLRPSGALEVLLDAEDKIRPMSMRSPLRQIKEADPERYRQLIKAAKDYSMDTIEQTLERKMMNPKDLEKYLRGVHAVPKYRPEHLWEDQ